MLPNRYDTKKNEAHFRKLWQKDGTYQFDVDTNGTIYSIDTPPATVSGNLHLGHVFSYSHPDFLARFWRMNGKRVFYPMGFDDNGLATGRLVEKRLGVRAQQIGRKAFVEKCLQISEDAERDYEDLWNRLGLSIDWRYTYRTIDRRSRRISQLSFIELYKKGLVYRRKAPSIWCPDCRTAIAQAELKDIERQSELYTLAFQLLDASREDDTVPIATTRPELLPACVAVFVHPEDTRYRHLVGKTCRVPIFDQQVPILEDRNADPEKGSGVVMCCTFGDTMDVAWWYKHNLPLVEGIDKEGRMMETSGDYAGLSTEEARKRIVQAAENAGLLLDRLPTGQSVRVHERCDTPVEYIVTEQWFIKVLDHKEKFIEIGERINWYPEHMGTRYRLWVENLNWDWCISRQRYHGIAFPVWYCQECGQVILADTDQLPVDPLSEEPGEPCSCGSTSFLPEADVMDTWATSSLTPQIVGQLTTLEGKMGGISSPGQLYERVYPFSVRTQGHEIIRTWAFYTIVKSHYHFNQIPWDDVLISGWGIAGEGMGKISKSRGGGPMAPVDIIDRYSADAVRYWGASTGPGKDSVISEEKIKLGAKLITKLWNVARFCERFLQDYQETEEPDELQLTPADRWILSRTQHLIIRATELYEQYDYAAAKSETETFFWRDLADNYLEMCKQRLYGETSPTRQGALYSLHHVLLSVLKLFAPLLPFVTETIYQGVYRDGQDDSASQHLSIHNSTWPRAVDSLVDDRAEFIGETLVDIATAVRRYKSEHNLSLGTQLSWLGLATRDTALAQELAFARTDLMSITRANEIEILAELSSRSVIILDEDEIKAAIKV